MGGEFFRMASICPTPNLFLRFQFALITFSALFLKRTTFDILNLNKRK
jgi:hypothetical protein